MSNEITAETLFEITRAAKHALEEHGAYMREGVDGMASAISELGQGLDSIAEAIRDQKRSAFDHLLVHVLMDEGTTNLQGQIIGVDGDYALIQVYDWWTGSATNVRGIKKEAILSGRLYAKHAEWVAQVKKSGGCAARMGGGDE